MSSKAVPLSDLKAGTVARFLEARLDADACQWLRGLGLRPSCHVRMCQRGEPCIVQVRSTRIGLSRAVARGLFVVPLTTGAA